MAGKKLTPEEFKKSFELAPRASANLLVINDRNEFLLTKRAIPPFENYWHLPGSFIKKGETIEDCITRVARRELGIDIDSTQAQLVGIFQDVDKDPRGHSLDIVYRFELPAGVKPTSTDETEEVEFFNKLPEKIGFNHRETLQKLGFT